MPFKSFVEITKAYVPLAFSTFGGPSAHVALFLDIFVESKKWLKPNTFSELFAISQSLPGPASTQLAFAIALIKSGNIFIALYSFFLWSFPCMCVMTALGIGVGQLTNSSIPSWVYALQNGLTSAAIGLVFLAAVKLAQKLLSSKLEILLCFVSGCVAINYSFSWLFPVLMVCGGTIFVLLERFIFPVYEKFTGKRKDHHEDVGDVIVENDEPIFQPAISQEEIDDFHEIKLSYTPKTSVILFTIWIIFLAISFYLRSLDNRAWKILGTFYYAGSIVYGGGPVVIPLLSEYTVTEAWLTEQEFLIGLALINALPGPMFNFAAFIGALSLRGSISSSILGAFLAYLGIFLPGLILISALIPLWHKYRSIEFFKLFFRGVNAGAVGLVFAAVYLLCLMAVSLPGVVGAVSIFGYPFLVVIAAGTFVGVGYLGVQAPVAVFGGGIIGIISFFV